MENLLLGFLVLAVMLLSAYNLYVFLDSEYKKTKDMIAYNKLLLNEIKHERKKCEVTVHNLKEYNIYAYLNRKQLSKVFDLIHGLPEENDTITGIKMNMSTNRSINQNAMVELNKKFAEYFKMSIDEYVSLDQRRIKAKNFTIGFSLQ